MDLATLVGCCLAAAPPQLPWTRGHDAIFSGKNDDATMRAMMNAFVDKSRTVGGTATSLSEIGYLSVGMDDGYVLCVRAHVCVCVRVCVCSTWYLCSHSLIVSTPLLLPATLLYGCLKVPTLQLFWKPWRGRPVPALALQR